MCGIVGFTGPADRSKLERMLELIVHRGPDGMGIHEEGLMNFGHRRLSVIDHDGGAQPFVSADQNFSLNYNGELYNFPELGQQISQRGQKLRTKSDTEVLLYWLAQNAPNPQAGLADLNGMFAFAFWDRKNKSLLLARDRLGIKPLYYTFVDGRLIFASEIKALLVWKSAWLPDYTIIAEHLSFQNVMSEQSFFKGVFKLQPGQWLQWSAEGTKQGTYWDVKFAKSFEGGFEDAVVEYQKTLQVAVKRHIIADVAVGAYTTSGLDSSSVATTAAGLLPRPMETFTGAFADATYYDERPGARLVSSAIQANHNDIVIRPEHFVENFEKVVWHLDEPTLGTGAFPQYMVSKLAASRVKVILTGHGGDELFAGYQVFKAMMVRKSASTSAFAFINALRRVKKDELTRVLYYLLAPLLYPEVSHGLFIMTAKSQRKKRFTDDFMNTFNDHEPLDQIRRIVEAGNFDPTEAMLALYLKTYLPTLFVQEDKMGMAHSLEARMPLCDNAMIDLALNVPADLKLHQGHLKAIPKAAMRDKIPQPLFGMAKRGFPTPFARWFRAEPVKSFMEDLLFSQRSRQRGIHDPKYVETLWQSNLNSRTDILTDYARANRLYSIALLEQWHRTFIDV